MKLSEKKMKQNGNGNGLGKVSLATMATAGLGRR